MNTILFIPVLNPPPPIDLQLPTPTPQPILQLKELEPDRARYNQWKSRMTLRRFKKLDRILTIRKQIAIALLASGRVEL